MSSNNWETAARFAKDPISREVSIWDGYMEAGAALIDETERRPVTRHRLLYPILFNYRHGLEVAMKWTIERYGKLANIALDGKDHDLWTLWVKCKMLLELPGIDDETLAVVEQL